MNANQYGTGRRMSIVSWIVMLLTAAQAFQPVPTFFQRSHTVQLRSSVGDGPPRRPPEGDSSGDMDNFLNPQGESENLARAREYMSEASLPISYETTLDADIVKDEEDNDDDDDEEIENNQTTESLAFPKPPTVGPALLDEPSAELLQNNPYLKVVSRLTPSELISKFTATAHPRVQNAVRTTILGLIGSLPKMAFDTTTITTGERLASLMFQLQMTGYMFKNAEYRLSLSQSLGMSNGALLGPSSNLLLTGSVDDHDDDDDEDPLQGKVRGKLKIRYDKGDNSEVSNGGMELEVDAAAYMSELRSEVSKLRDELSLTRQAKDETLRKDLLTYIRTLPAQELRSLTSTISQEVLVAMKGLVNVVMAGIGEGEIGPETVTEQSGEAMAQLCMWQLVVGFNMRELEVREQMKKSLARQFQDDGGVDFSEPGVLE